MPWIPRDSSDAHGVLKDLHHRHVGLFPGLLLDLLGADGLVVSEVGDQLIPIDGGGAVVGFPLCACCRCCFEIACRVGVDCGLEVNNTAPNLTELSSVPCDEQHHDGSTGLASRSVLDLYLSALFEDLPTHAATGADSGAETLLPVETGGNHFCANGCGVARKLAQRSPYLAQKTPRHC